MIFLIDFENVSNSGFDGLEDLSAADKVIVFYSEKSSSISMATHRKLEASSATKEYVGVKAGGKNALDFQLSTYLGYLLAKDSTAHYSIVSNDTGYDFVLDFWKQRGVTILRCTNLSQDTKESLLAEVAKLLPENQTDLEKITGIVGKYKTNQGINNALMKEFGSEKTGLIYKALRPLLQNKKGR